MQPELFQVRPLGMLLSLVLVRPLCLLQSAVLVRPLVLYYRLCSWCGPCQCCLWCWYGPGARYRLYVALVPVATSGPGAGFGRVTFCAHGAAQVPITACRRDMRPFGLRMERRILIRHFAPLQPKQTASPNPKMRPTSHDSKVSCPIHGYLMTTDCTQWPFDGNQLLVMVVNCHSIALMAMNCRSIAI